MAVNSELLNENLQTYEEFRLSVERHLYGESLDPVTPGDIPTKPIEEVVFESPKPPEDRIGLPHFSPLVNVLDRR